MWKEDSKVIFVTKVVERNVVAISNAAVELRIAGDSKTASAKPEVSKTFVEIAGFGASLVFAGIQKGLAALPASEKAKLIKKTNSVFAFTITNGEKKVQSWFVDVKNGEGSVGVGAVKADMTIAVQDKDFLLLANGNCYYCLF